ncbi:MAG: hypothetical protein ACN4GW_01220 [Desulforhopalus sp.]
MEIKTATLLFLTVFPLICTPGPDIISDNGRGKLETVAGAMLAWATIKMATQVQ